MKSKSFIAVILATLIATLLFCPAAFAKKPEVVRHDAQYLDKQISVNVQWQSSEPVVLVRVSAGREVKDIRVDAYDNKRNRDGYGGEVQLVLMTDPYLFQESIPYTIQLQDEDGQKSNLMTGKVPLPTSTLGRPQGEDQWGRDRLSGQGHPGAPQQDMIDKLRAVAQVLAAPPFLQDIEVINPGTGTVMFKTKATHTVGLREVNFRLFDGANKQIDTQQIPTTGKFWEGTSKDFTLTPGNYYVIVQAVDGSGNTSQERRAFFSIAGAPLQGQPQQPQTQPQAFLLVVTILPQDVLTKGAQWRLAAKDWKNSGDGIATGLQNGWYDVEFKDVPGWKKPDPLKVSIEIGKTTTATGTYTQDTGFAKVYTTNSEFEQGTLVGLEDKTVPDQLQLTKTSTTLPFIWIPNSNEGTISKVDTKTGTELGRYRTGPGTNGSPSRTTVDQQGNCWVGNRNTGTVVKVGLVEAGQCTDRNGNGKIETSEGSTPLPWGQDECVLYEVALFSGKEATYVPGQYTGGYDGAPGPRGIAIDRSNNLWAGTYGTHRYYNIDGKTGRILRTIDTSSASHMAYGAVVDKNGILWSSDIGHNHVLRLDPASGSFRTISLGHNAYGVGLDAGSHLFVAGWVYNKLSRINTGTAQIEWTKDGESGIRGVAVTSDGDVWTANSYSNSVTRWSNDGVRKASITGFNHPTGVAVDAEGKVWAVNYNDNLIKRIDPATNQVDLQKAIGSGHYGYSDMTGIVARSMTTKIGTWTVICDTQRDSVKFATLSWSGAEPAGTSIKVRVRSSVDRQNWSAWEDAVKGTELKATPAGRYAQVEATLQILTGEAAPVLTDLTIQGK